MSFTSATFATLLSPCIIVKGTGIKIGNVWEWGSLVLLPLVCSNWHTSTCRLCSERMNLVRKRKVLQRCFLVWKEALKSVVTLRCTQNVYRLKCKRLVDSNNFVSSPSMFWIKFSLLYCYNMLFCLAAVYKFTFAGVYLKPGKYMYTAVHWKS